MRVYSEIHSTVRSWTVVNRDTDAAELNVDRTKFSILFQA